MEWVLRIMANLLRPDELGPAEVAYKVVAAHRRRRPRALSAAAAASLALDAGRPRIACRDGNSW